MRKVPRQGERARVGRAAADAVVRLVLDGRSYVIVPEAFYDELVAAAASGGGTDAVGWAAWEADAEALGERLTLRRRQAGLSQVALARLADIRVETLNRIEKGHTSPDYATVRRLVLALRGAKGAAGMLRRGRREEGA